MRTAIVVLTFIGCSGVDEPAQSLKIEPLEGLGTCTIEDELQRSGREWGHGTDARDGAVAQGLRTLGRRALAQHWQQRQPTAELSRSLVGAGLEAMSALKQRVHVEGGF